MSLVKRGISILSSREHCRAFLDFSPAPFVKTDWCISANRILRITRAQLSSGSEFFCLLNRVFCWSYTAGKKAAHKLLEFTILQTETDFLECRLPPSLDIYLRLEWATPTAFANRVGKKLLLFIN